MDMIGKLSNLILAAIEGIGATPSENINAIQTIHAILVADHIRLDLLDEFFIESEVNTRKYIASYNELNKEEK